MRVAARPSAPRPLNPEQVFLVRMHERADLRDEARMPRGPARREAVWRDLVATSARTQEPVLDHVAALVADGSIEAIRSVPIANALVVTARLGRSRIVERSLRELSSISTVLRNLEGADLDARAAATNVATARRRSTSLDDAAWGVAAVGAPPLWRAGVTGTGVTVGVVDSGVDVAHPALRDAYRGTRELGEPQHDYAWFDARGYATGQFAAAPADELGHGTHVAASAVGGAGLGVAPGARLIAARLQFSNDILGAVSTLDALQFMLAPTRRDGTAPQPRLGADIVNNSWGLAAWEQHVARDAIDALEAAGTIVVSSAGNGGRRGAPVSAPGGYPGHITVAATTPEGSVAPFSSSGPSPIDPSALLPNIAAPGADVVSAAPGGGIAKMSGTSMAAPHVSGVAALLLQARPDATPQMIRDALFGSARDIDAPGPDLRSGHGLVHAGAAVELIRRARR